MSCSPRKTWKHHLGQRRNLMRKPHRQDQKQSPCRERRNAGAGGSLRTAAAILAALVLTAGTGSTALAASDPLAVIDNLSTFIFALIRAVGIIMLGFGIVQVGLSLKGHDPAQRANGFLTLAGGVIVTFTREILALITS
ncbi:MAG: glutamyl-tRNA amidotransferase [Clostridium sp.]|nr:glutamyl-tRNA amidotransferase [Clostridium sp.]